MTSPRTGILRNSASRTARPSSVYLPQKKKIIAIAARPAGMNQNSERPRENDSNIRVSSGSLAFSEAKNPWNLGRTKITITALTTMASTTTIDG